MLYNPYIIIPKDIPQGYEFYSNVHKDAVYTIGGICDICDIPYITKTEAYDIFGQIIPDNVAFYVYKNEEKWQLFANVYSRILTKYFDMLNTAGIRSEEILSHTDIYLGCEKKYWPDKTFNYDLLKL